MFGQISVDRYLNSLIAVPGGVDVSGSLGMSGILQIVLLCYGHAHTFLPACLLPLTVLRR